LHTAHAWSPVVKQTPGFDRIYVISLFGCSVYRLLGGRTKERIPVYASRLYSMPIDKLRAEAQKYKDEGYQAMKLRYGWGPLDGRQGMIKNVELVRNVREVIGDGIDLMTDAYMGWTLDYAKRMLP
jgi:L-rhamnonate dehydratase